MKISMDVDSCRECPHSTNNRIEHDDPFTSGPSHVYWWCEIPHKGDRLYIEDSYIIDPNCPHK